ncbi:MAG: substrate-binding domain-containing protein [Candidatus Sumerlaeota bacterium]|nr:substrate-binding domain-containing protein [Candidatus Sumerlaeota bacterium]
MTKKHAIVAALPGLCALAMLMTFACDRGQESKPAAGGEKKFKIAGIIFQDDEFFRMTSIGMKAAARKAGVEYLEGNSNNKPDKEIELVNTYISSKVDALVISPIGAESSVAALKRAHDAGIKIIIHNSPVKSDIPLSTIESNQGELGTQCGKVARKFIEEKLGGKANIGILAFRSQLAEQSDARTNGFKNEIKDLPGVKFVAEQEAWLKEMGMNKASDILTANPDINILWSANEGGTVGEVMAVKNKGKAGKIFVFGTDTSEQLTKFLLDEDNILQATAGQQPYEIGAMAVEATVKALKGEKLENHVVVPVLLLTRAAPDKVKEFQKTWDARISGK